MYIIFDSNIWISELGLNSSKGAATRFFVKEKNAKVVVPEVVKLETQRKLKNDLKEYISEIKKNYRQLLAIFGKLKEIVLPDEDEINEIVQGIFERSHLEIIEIPLSLESARNSFLKTIDKLPPSDKDQQFKDGVIWADCLLLLEDSDVFLVTRDSAFYQDRKYENGLAKSLLQEAMELPNKIRVFPSVSDLLPEIVTDIKLEGNKLVRKFFDENQISIERILSKNHFAPVGEPEVRTDLFATEDPNKLYVEFTILYHCEDLTYDNRVDAKLSLKGDCIYSVNEQEFSMMRNYGEEVTFINHEGEVSSLRNVVLFANGIVIGHKTIEHSIRYKLAKKGE